MTEIKVHKCPICHKETADEKYAPFCSKRCADIDLGRWFNGDYAVPAQELDEQDITELTELTESAEEEESASK
jgi:hypothetical protein